MSDLSLLVANGNKPLHEDKGVHYERIKALIPEAITKAPLSRLKSLKGSVAIPESYRSLNEGERKKLKQSLLTHWQLQGVLDTTLKGLEQDIQAFARPLLAQAIKDRFKVGLDVDTTTLKLYVPDKIIFDIDRGATRARHSSLLEAALHNFEALETEAGAFRSGSGVYTPDQTGALRLHTITTEQFAGLCRTLDIGAQYQKHIKALLTPTDATARDALKTQSVAVEKSALEIATLTASMASDIGGNAQSALKAWISGKAGIQFNGQPLHAHRLRLFGLPLSGVVLFSAVAQKNVVQNALLSFLPKELQFLFDWSRRIPGLNDNLYEKYKVVSDAFANGPRAVTDEIARRNDFYDQSILTGPVIAYLPDDPLHPLKEYASLTAFMKALITQLLDKSYQQYFSRFVAQKDKPKFFKRVNERLKEITWHQREPLTMGPWWRETLVENPDAEPITVPIGGELWEYLYREKRDKAIADARLIAVPTDDEDAKTRWNRLVKYLDYGWNIFNFGVMLVPGMGEVVLGVMVAQLMADVAEGIEDWSKGDKDEASAHFNSIIINFAQLALMGAGHILPGGVTAIKPSPFVDNLKPVSMADDSSRLWNPDLAPYEHKIPLPEGSRPDELGLHQHRGKHVLRVEDRQFVVKEDVETSRHRLQHPTRTGAYAPEVEHNAAGAWKTELERPIEWEKAQLLRRLNPLASSFSEATLEQVLTVSGVEEGVLRRLHVEHDLPPPMLTDTLDRFDLYARTSKLGEQIRNGAVHEYLAGYLPGLMTELPRWPESKAIKLFDPLAAGRESVTYGFADATAANTLTVTLDELKTGKLESRVLESLNESEVEGLLGKAISTDKNVRIKALRDELATRATKRQAQVFESQYKDSQASTDAQVGKLQGDYPDLPRNVIEQLLKEADTEDLRFLKEKSQVPLTLRQQIRAARHTVRMSRAYEGLYLRQLENTDTRRLQLSSLQSLPGWSSNVRIEIRESSFTGTLQTSVGPQGAPIRKVLILDEDGRYNARDAQGLHLHGADDFYSSLLHALPDTERQALGYEIFQGDKLREAVQRSPLGHESFEQVLLDHPVRKPAYDAQNARLRGGMQGYAIQRPGWRELQGRVRSLYPALADEEVESMLGAMGEGMAEQRVRALEDEFNTFNRSFQRWMNSPTQAFRFSPEGVAEWASRNQVYKALRQCWQRTGPHGIEAPGIIRPQALNLDNLPMDQHLRGMPGLTANFDHVTELSLRKTGMLSSQEHFLSSFPQLRKLDLFRNRLRSFPTAISDMSFLRSLVLSDNLIVLTRESVARLRAMKRLSTLLLRDNPLGLVPDVSQMPDLVVLGLGNTLIDTWPTGLFAKPRPRSMVVDLKNNRINRLPVVAPGSVNAELIARTIISRESGLLSKENLAQLKLYIESVGLDPDRPYPPRGALDSSSWAAGMTEAEWQAHQPFWDAVEDEFGSEPFFNEVRKLTESKDFTAEQEDYRVDLTAKVWRMIKAMEENTALRKYIFKEATAPTTCVDAGAQFFNAMGVRVLVHEAKALRTINLVEAELVTLARGKARLDELGALARRRVTERLEKGETFRRVVNGVVTGTIDEVEVYLGYMTDLAERLDLPWQSRDMMFRKTAGLTQKILDDAYLHVVAGEQGELLAQQIIEQDFWVEFLEKTYKKELKALADSLEDADEVAQFEASKALLKTLTQQAIDRAKLQRVEIPFTVEP